MKKKLRRYIGDRHFYKMLLAIVVPIIIQNGITNFVSLLDNLMVGRIGTEQMSGVAIVNQLIFVFNLCIFGAVSGAGIFTAQFFGHGDHEGVRNTFRFKFLISIAFSIIGIAAFLSAGSQLISLFLHEGGESGDIMQTLKYGEQYLGWILLGLLPFAISQVYSGTLRETGETIVPMAAGVAAVFVNLIFNYLLIYGSFGFPKLGVEGAAIATVAAQAVSVILAIIILKKKNYGFHIKKRDFKINKQCKRFVRVGLPLALQEFLTQMSFLALCAFINKLGLEASSGYGVACKIVNFAMLVPSALMQSMASFVSQNVGAGKNERARKSMFTGMGVGLVVGAVVFICVWNFGDYLTSIFTTDSAVIQKGAEYLRGFAPETIVTAILFSMVGFFNGNEKTVWVMIQGLIQTLLVRLPLAYIMSIQPHASLTKIGLAAPVATCFGIVLNVIFYIVFVRKNTCRIKKK